MTSKMEPANNTFPFVFEQNTTNQKVQRGIENLFPESTFTEDFYTAKAKADGGFHATLEKRRVQMHLIEHGQAKDFEGFKPLIEKIRLLLNEQ